MFRVLSCLSGEHDWRLVVLAGLVCFLASLVAVSLFHRACATRGRARTGWLALAGTATGCGIWATHFIAMLAYEPGVAIAYDIPLTALSLVAAGVVTFTGLSVAVRGSQRWFAPIGGGIVGAGVACMHYTGMWAVQLPGHVTWLAELVLASIVLGVLFGTAALAVAIRRDDIRATFIAALLLTLAIVSHHFTAMGAVEIVPDPARLIAPFSLSPPAMAISVAGVAIAVLGMSLIGALADRRLAVQTAEFTRDRLQLIEESKERLREQHVRLDAALNNMHQGLLMFDVDGRLILHNQSYLQMYGLSAQSVKVGCSLSELLQLHIEAGALAGDADDHIREFDDKACSVSEVVLADGRTISITNQSMRGGGWVSTHDDITERRRAEIEREQARTLLNTFALFEATFENVNQGIMMTDSEGRVQVCNRRAVELLELPSELMSARPRFDDVLDYLRHKGVIESPEDAAENWANHIEGPYPSFQRRRPNGVTLEIRNVPLPGGGVVRTFADVSELLKKERLSVLGQLTATVAHELRNPLSAIRNTVPVIRQLIAATTLDLDRPMSRIERSIGRCDQLVTGLLDYTRPTVLNCKPTYVDPWLDALLTELAAPDGILIERKFSAPDALINVDAERFRRVIINLMDNAAHSLAQDQGSAADRRITISTSASDQVEIEIADTGRGIRPRCCRKFSSRFSAPRVSAPDWGCPRSSSWWNNMAARSP